MSTDFSAIPESTRLLEKFYKQADNLEANGEKLASDILRFAADRAFLKGQHGNMAYLNAFSNLKFIPVGIEEFLESDEFLGGTDFKLWPELKKIVIETKHHPLLTCKEPQVNRFPVTEIFYTGAIGIGKCLGKGTKVLMHNGNVKCVEDIKEGDLVAGDDYTPRKVLTTVKGREPLYKIKFKRGGAEDFICNESHMLSLKYTLDKIKYSGMQKDKKVDISVKDFLNLTPTEQNMVYKMYKSGYDWEPKKISIDPYYLGVWLGDGKPIDGRLLTFSKKNQTLVDYVKDYAQYLNGSFKLQDNITKSNEVISGEIVSTKLNEEFIKLNLINNKHIPNEYKLTDKTTRLHVLAGLLDTTGSTVKQKNSSITFEVMQKNKTLAEDICFIARSLEFYCSVKEKEVNGVTHYRLILSGKTWEIPTKLKKVVKRPLKENYLNFGFDIEPLGEGDYYGFSLDGNHRFLLGDFTVSHNTFGGMASVLYDAYLLSCFKNPHALFERLSSNTPIVFSLHMNKFENTKRNLYGPLRRTWEAMPFVKKYIPYSRSMTTSLIINDIIHIVPMIASPDSYIGQNLIGGIFDEMNFLEVIQESKKAQGAIYDQAEELYRGASTRRASRFITHGPDIGTLWVCSSTAYVNDFISRRIQQLDSEKDKHVKTFNKKQYEVQPTTALSGETFRFLVGTPQYNGRILDDNEKAGINYPKDAWVENVPVEYEPQFRKDPDIAQRDVLGIASGAISKYIGNPQKIYDAINLFKKNGRKVYVSPQNVDLAGDTGFPRVLSERIPEDKDEFRFIHVDLSRVKDRCGIAIVKVDKWVTRQFETLEAVPHLVVEAAISIQPNSVNELQIAEVRNWIQSLKTIHGINVRKVSYDGFDSQESIQLLRKNGILSDHISMDKTPDAYETTKQALYQDRLELPHNEIMIDEFVMLERRMRGDTFKIDHPSNTGVGKDITDAIAGAVYSAVTFMANRGNYSVTGRKKAVRKRGKRKAKRR